MCSHGHDSDLNKTLLVSTHFLSIPLLSMASRFPCPKPMIPRGHKNKTRSGIFMLHSSHMQPNGATAAIPIRSHAVNKVFEDRSMGIVCYRDEKGQVICEGYDEGPRFCQLASQSADHHRELLMRCLFPTIKDSNVLGIPNGAVVKEQKEPRSSYWNF